MIYFSFYIVNKVNTWFLKINCSQNFCNFPTNDFVLTNKRRKKIKTAKRNAHFKISIFLINVGGDGYKNLERHSSNSSIASSQGEPPVKTWHSMVQTYKIIMNTLHIKPHMKRPQTKEIVIYVTSVFDQKCFWGQVVEDVSENTAFIHTILNLYWMSCIIW